MFSSFFVCLLATLRKKTSERICMKFSGKVGNGPLNKQFKFGGDQGGQKILIRQMAGLISRH